MWKMYIPVTIFFKADPQYELKFSNRKQMQGFFSNKHVKPNRDIYVCSAEAQKLINIVFAKTSLVNASYCSNKKINCFMVAQAAGIFHNNVVSFAQWLNG